MEKLKQLIKNFTPTCEQEERDKEYFLKFIDTFDDVLTRENVFGHLSSSAWVLNKDRTKVLLVYHNIMEGYIFPGGHVDGETDCLSVALREVEEETGIKVKPISEEVFSIWTGPVKAHIKRGKYVSAHTHLDIDFLCVADENQPLKIKPDENQNVIWADINEIGKSIKLVDFFMPVFENFKCKIKKDIIMEEINEIKQAVKKVGFSVKNNLCHKIENDILFVLNFHKRADGIYNTEMGICLGTNKKTSLKSCDCVETLWGNFTNTEEKIQAILQWFKDRNTIDKVKGLYWNGKLATVCDISLKEKLK